MTYVSKCILLLPMLLASGSCDSIDSDGTKQYRIETDGAPATTDRNVYDSLGDVTFTMNQRYKVLLTGAQKAKPHLLVFNMKQKIGDKVEVDEKGLSVTIIDGMKTIDCRHYYDVKIPDENDAPAPVCEFQLIGYLEMDGLANLAESTN